MNTSLTPTSVLSLGKSSPSNHLKGTTSHDQCTWSIVIVESEYPSVHYNGFQFRQVYSFRWRRKSHFQTQHENKPGMHIRRWVIWEKACLVITLHKWEYSSTPTKHNRNHPFEPFPKHPHSQPQPQCNQRRNQNRSSGISFSDSSSNGNDD